MANGHPYAPEYPVWKVWFESQLIVERTNSLIATNALVLQSALATTIETKDGGRKAFDNFQKLIKGLTDEP